MPEIPIQQREHDWRERNAWRVRPIVERFAEPDAIANATTDELYEARGLLAMYGDSRGEHRELVEAIGAENTAREELRYREALILIGERQRAELESVSADATIAHVEELSNDRPELTVSELLDELRREAEAARQRAQAARDALAAHDKERGR